jgi:acyl dehydratase
MFDTPLAPLEKPRFTSTHILRWLAAQQNWDKIHFDQQFTRDVARLEATVVNGALKQHWIAQFLAQSFPNGWIWRIDYRFIGPDLVGEKLRVQGHVTGSQALGGHVFVSVQVEIINLDRAKPTTLGNAIVIFAEDGACVLDGIGIESPPGMSLSQEVAAVDNEVAPAINAWLGKQTDQRKSCYPVDLSRLRLFADAVMGLAPVHFDPAAASASPWGGVVAPPLFPLHGLEAMPDSLPLSEDPRAQGREGVNEIGRDVAERFGLDAAGGLNGGNRVQIHSLARAGERIEAVSKLVGAHTRTGKRGGQMLLLETLNLYSESGGRPLLTERQTVVLRLLP